MKHRGDLTITADNAAMYSDLTEVTGWLYLSEGASLTAPVLKVAGHSLPTPEVAVERIRAVAAEALLTPQALDMTQWHRCSTTHCIAGWAIHLAGPEGYKLEREVGAATANAILLGVEAATMFHTSTATARKWLEGFISNPTPEAA